MNLTGKVSESKAESLHSNYIIYFNIFSDFVVMFVSNLITVLSLIYLNEKLKFLGPNRSKFLPDTVLK